MLHVEGEGIHQFELLEKFLLVYVFLRVGRVLVVFVSVACLLLLLFQVLVGFLSRMQQLFEVLLFAEHELLEIAVHNYLSDYF